MAKVITVAQVDITGMGRFIGTFTQLKIALDFIEPEGMTIDGGKPYTYSRMTTMMRKDQCANLHDAEGFVVYSFLRNEINPEKKETKDACE